jgi:hypothetical protein
METNKKIQKENNEQEEDLVHPDNRDQAVDPFEPLSFTGRQPRSPDFSAVDRTGPSLGATRARILEFRRIRDHESNPLPLFTVQRTVPVSGLQRFSSWTMVLNPFLGDIKSPLCEVPSLQQMLALSTVNSHRSYPSSKRVYEFTPQICLDSTAHLTSMHAKWPIRVCFSNGWPRAFQ